MRTQRPQSSLTANRTDARLAAAVAALASMGASVIHLSVVPGHWQQWPLSAVFFVGVAVLQLVWGLVALRVSSPLVMAAGIAASLGLMTLWGVSRLWGLPVGPAAGTPEAVSAAGVMAAALEGLIVLGSACSLLPRERTALFSAGSYRLALGGAVVVVAVLMAPGVAGGLAHTHGGPAHPDTGGHHHEEAPEVEQATPGPQTTPGPAESPADSPMPSPTGHQHGHSHS